MNVPFKGEVVSFAFLLSTTLSFALSTGANAQAPVSDLSDTTNSATSQAATSSTSVASNTLSLGSLEERIAVLERIIKSRNVMQQQLQSQLDQMQLEVDELRGSVELHTNQLEKVLQRQRELYLEIDKRVESIKSTQVAIDNATASAVAPPVANNTTALSETDAYDLAVNLILKTREYDKAIPAFEAFLNSYPQSEFADNAHYWLGQLLFNKQKWADAETSFATVVTQFTDSSKRADAMMKLGVIKQNTGKDQDAKSWFERVINEYPNSSAAKLAKSRMN